MRGLARSTPFLLAAVLCASTAVAETTVTYIANAGFLLAAGEKKVLIDALFDSGLGGYQRIPAGLRPFLEGAAGPFEGVDLVLSTHHHGDHFGHNAVINHLRANPAARFVSTPQAVGRVRLQLRDEPELRLLVQELLPEEGDRTSFSHRGIAVDALNLHHGRDRDPPVQNLGFLVDLDGFKILHIGDTEAGADVFAPLALAADGIDVALLPAWFLTVDEWIHVVRRHIRPRSIVAMHIAEPGAPVHYFGEDGGYEQRLEKIRENFPAAVILERPGDARRYGAAPEPTD